MFYPSRRESGVESNFRLDSPATSERIRMACVDQFTEQVSNWSRLRPCSQYLFTEKLMVEDCCNDVLKQAFLYIFYTFYSSYNRAGGLHGRILTEVVSTDRGQDSAIQTDLARLIRCLLYGKTKNNLIHFM